MEAPLPLQDVLVYAPPSRRGDLVAAIVQPEGPFRCVDEARASQRRPDLVIWVVEASSDPLFITAEAVALEQRWHPAPLLLVLEGTARFSPLLLADLAVAGILENPDAAAIRQALPVLAAGGRVFDVAARGRRGSPGQVDGGVHQPFAQGIAQIDAQLQLVAVYLQKPDLGMVLRWVLEGQRRELTMARLLVLRLWTVVAMALGLEEGQQVWPGAGEQAATASHRVPPASTAVILRSRTAEGVWDTLSQRLLACTNTCHAAALDRELLALSALAAGPRSSLLRQLLEEMGSALLQARGRDVRGGALLELWAELQWEIMQHALQHMGGAYLRIPRDGALVSVTEQLLALEVPNGQPVARATLEPLLAALVRAEPVVIDGRLFAPDTPAALLHLERLLSDWLLRLASLLAALVLEEASRWPELRRFLLRQDLLPTRELERLRNRLNAHERYEQLVLEPVRIYESRRELLLLQPEGVVREQLVDPRDQELRQLGFVQRGVTFALEARDALGPQLRALGQRLGALLVVVLTQVIGRGIGLVGRGVLIGLGRSLQGGNR